MKNKLITWLIFGLCLVLIVSVFIPEMLASNNILGILEKVYQYAENEDWTSANEAAEDLMTQWKSQKLALALNYAEEDYATFQHTILRVTNAVKNEDKENAMAESDVAKNIIKQNFIRFAPEP